MSIPAAKPVSHPNGAGSLLPVACLLVIGSLLGLTSNLTKLAGLMGGSPLTSVFAGALASGVFLQLINYISGRTVALSRETINYALISGLLSIGLPHILIASSIPHVGAAFAAMSSAFPILLTFALAVLLRLERFQTARAIGVLLGLTGGVVLAASKARAGDSAPIWIILTLASPIFIAIGNIHRTIKWPKGVSPVSLAPGMLIAGALWMLPIVVMQPAQTLLISVTPPLLLLAALQAAIFGALYTLYFLLQYLTGPVYLSQIGTVGAVVGAIIATIVFAEQLPHNLAIAAGLIAAGIVLVNRRVARRAQSASS